MRVISMKRLRTFWNTYPDAEPALRRWHKIALHSKWGHLQAVRATFASANSVKTSSGEQLTVFNICGNKYRLIARVNYPFQLVNVRAVLTHNEYDQENWKG